MFIVRYVFIVCACVFVGYFEAAAELTEEVPFSIRLGVVKPGTGGSESYELDAESQPHKLDGAFDLYAVVCWGRYIKLMNTRE